MGPPTLANLGSPAVSMRATFDHELLKAKGVIAMNVQVHLENLIRQSQGFTEALLGLKDRTREVEQVILKQCADAQAELARGRAKVAEAKGTHVTGRSEHSEPEGRPSSGCSERSSERRPRCGSLIDGWPRRAVRRTTCL